MKIFTACLGTETNSFAPLPTQYSDFEEFYFVRNGAHTENLNAFAIPLVLWRDRAREKGWNVAEGLAAFASPGGPTVRAAFEQLRDEILDDLGQAMPVDAVMLSLHGAMIAQGYDDCEGDLIARIREIVGPDVAIGAELDLHCLMTRKMVANADALITFKEYPHVDFSERAEELWTIISGKLEGRLQPTMVMHDTQMVGLYHTTRQPMRAFVDSLQTLEAQRPVLSVSMAHGFPWSDMVENTSKFAVITDGDEALGNDIGKELCQRLWDIRDEVQPQHVGIDEALDQALACEGGPVTLGDMSDNPGGGGAGDATFIAHRILERKITNAAIGAIWDPQAVAICFSHGEGARIDLRLGGKTSRHSGPPLDLSVKIERLMPKLHIEGNAGGKRYLGDAVWLSASGIDFVVQSVRGQVMSPEIFSAFGIDPKAKKILVVKSMQHFVAEFAPVSAKIIYVAAPGTLEWDFARLPYKKAGDNCWPAVAHPHFANR